MKALRTDSLHAKKHIVVKRYHDNNDENDTDIFQHLPFTQDTYIQEYHCDVMVYQPISARQSR